MFVESFSDEETEILERFFTNTALPVFCLVNLPEVTKAALFARYSRTHKSLRRLFLDEFWDGETQQVAEEAQAGTSRSSKLFETVLDGYGDDSVAQLGGAHIACEGVSNILTKVIERPRLGSYLEQSTRYINFADKLDGRYRYVTPIGMHTDSSVLPDQYTRHMDQVFAGYAQMVDAATEFLRGKHIVPREDSFESGELAALERAIRADALDACRGLLPAGTTSNLGMFASGQTYEALVVRMLSSDLSEARHYGSMMLTELRKVIPQFLKRVDLPDRGVRHGEYLRENRQALKALAATMGEPKLGSTEREVKLVRFSSIGESSVAAAALYPHSNLSATEIGNRMTDKMIDATFAAAVGDRSHNRRLKPGRSFEYSDYEFDVCSDYGAFRDLQRHRLLTMDWQPLSPDLGYEVPELIIDADLEDEYRTQMDETYQIFEVIAEAYGVEEARYVVPLGFNIRYSIKANARALVHMLELRTGKQGHSTYRKICQEMFFQVRDVAGHRRIAAAMSHVQTDDVDMARLESEQKLEADKNSAV